MNLSDGDQSPSLEDEYEPLGELSLGVEFGIPGNGRLWVVHLWQVGAVHLRKIGAKAITNVVNLMSNELLQDTFGNVLRTEGLEGRGEVLDSHELHLHRDHTGGVLWVE